MIHYVAINTFIMNGRQTDVDWSKKWGQLNTLVKTGIISAIVWLAVALLELA
jgi:hypothetical protein